MKPIIKIENLSKQYRLGIVGTGTISNDIKRWWHRARGKEDPFLKIGETNDRSSKGKSEYVWALKDINLEVMQGEVLGIIGKNGAGKSTLLKILSKVTGPTTGKIYFNGRIGSLLEVGTGFHQELTGRENIFLNGAILGMTKAEIKSKLDEIVDFSGCERYIDTPVKRYSSGMMVRLGFAVAAHLEPEILVVDEVLAVGDAEFQKKAIGKMQDVSRNDGRTVLFVSHNMAAVESLCNACIMLQNGQLVAHGQTNEIISAYLTKDLNKSTDLLTIDVREGKGDILFTKLALYEEGKKVEMLRSGRNVRIQLHYKCLIDKKFDNCRIGVAVLKDNKNLFVLASELVHHHRITLQKSGHINFDIDELPLSKGEYGLTLFLESENIVQDQLSNCISLNVEDGDFYGIGRNYPNGWQGKTTLVKHHFSYDKETH